MIPAWTIALGVLGATLVVGLVLATAARRARTSHRRVEQQLEASRTEVAELADQVSRLAAQVEAGRRRTAEEQGFVITTLSEAAQVSGSSPGQGVGPSGTPLAEVLEQQAVSRLAQVDTTTRVGTRLAELGVRAVALSHGVRRALSPENLDRAAAEAHVARRRSRRTRREELREARRLLRTVRAQQPVRDRSSEGAA